MTALPCPLLTGAAALAAEVPWARAVWVGYFLDAIADEAGAVGAAAPAPTEPAIPTTEPVVAVEVTDAAKQKRAPAKERGVGVP